MNGLATMKTCHDSSSHFTPSAKDEKIYIVMAGLPARGKSTVAFKLKECLEGDGIRTQIFNNGDLRRKLLRRNTSYAGFYDPKNAEGLALREKFSRINIEKAKQYLKHNGQVAILDATNVSVTRREKIASLLNNHPLLFIECINDDPEILKASIMKKITLPEFSHLSQEEAISNFDQRILYYESIYGAFRDERNYIKLDSLKNRVMEEVFSEDIYFYDRIRDVLGTDTVKNLFLIRHGETFYNLEDRIGGDPGLTDKGKAQAEALARHFSKRQIPYIFTSQKKRTIETAEPIRDLQKNCMIVPLAEFNEIDSGVCECMSYEEIREKMPQVSQTRKEDKYNYIYPEGEGYVTMTERIDNGIKKALYLSSNATHIMIIGHRAVNRMILSHFLYRREADVPYIYIPQDKFYHIAATQDRKLFQLKSYG